MDSIDQTKLEIFANHYNKTFELLKADVVKRDRLFIYMLVTILILLLYISIPNTLSNWINSFINHSAGSGNSANGTAIIDVSFIGSVLWFGLLSLSHTYFQIVIHIERQYHYVYMLEDHLGKQFDEHAFIREGKHYRDNKRRFSSWTKFIFWYLFPILFLVIIIYCLSSFIMSHPPIPYIIINGIIFLSILVSLGLYLWALHKEK